MSSNNLEEQQQQQGMPYPGTSSHNDDDCAHDDNVGVVWKNLTAWIHDHGGFVHPDLELRTIQQHDLASASSSSSSSSSSSLDDITKKSSSTTHRGVFAKKAIAVNELLIRLPFHLAIHGNDPNRFPRTYNYHSSSPCTSSRQETLSTGASSKDAEELVPVDESSSSSNSRATSAWLRCLAAYYYYQDAPNDDDSKNIMAPYFASLPAQYETVAAWTRDEITEYLAGTTFGSSGAAAAVGGDGSLNWQVALDETLLRERYTQQIRPYLVHCQVLPAATPPPRVDPFTLDYGKEGGGIAQDDQECRRFFLASQCMSTRCFHLSQEQQQQHQQGQTAKPAATRSSTPANNNSDEDAHDVYTGPFLLPVIDLLNHASRHDGETRVTTLVHGRDDDIGSNSSSSSSSFTMTAERSIAAGQEILHSYGNDLNASQFLQTFGFVPRATMERCIEIMTTAKAEAKTSSSSLTPTINVNTDSNHGPAITPAFLSKTSILEACWSVVEDDDYPSQLARSMQLQCMDDGDETWTIQLDKTRSTDFIPDNLLISYPNSSIIHDDDNDSDESSILTDELVTLACIPFLPKCAYAEVAQSFLGREILQDYFLGNLVCKSLLKAIRHKMASYKLIQSPFDNNDNNGCTGGSKLHQNDKGQNRGSEADDDDFILLRQLLDASRNNNKKSSTATTYLNSSLSTTRLMCGLTVRLEEKLSLRALRKEVMMILANLDDNDDEGEDDNRGGLVNDDEDHVDSKRQKL